jgi:hypothetical protein
MNSSTTSSRGLGLVLVAATLVPVLTVLAASEMLLRRRVAPSDHLLRQAELFRARPGSDAAFGDSQVARGITGLPGLANFGFPGDNARDVSAKVRACYAQPARGRAPRVILQGSPQTFNRLDHERRSTALFLDGPPPLLVLSPYFAGGMLQHWLALFTNPAFQNRYVLAPDGAQLAEGRPRSGQSDLEAALRRMTPRDDFADGPAARDLEALFDHLAELGAEVCILTPPLLGVLAQRALEHPSVEASRGWFDRQARERDFRRVDLFENSLPRRHYFDLDHLNASGARHVSPLVYEACFAGAESRRREAARALGGRS